jgi:hypothetical protein
MSDKNKLILDHIRGATEDLKASNDAAERREISRQRAANRKKRHEDLLVYMNKMYSSKGNLYDPLPKVEGLTEDDWGSYFPYGRTKKE